MLITAELAQMIIEIFQKDEFKDFLQGCFWIAEIGEVGFMDLVYKRYSNPMELIDNMILFLIFQSSFLNLLTMSQTRKLYDIWKSKVYDKSYADFKNEMMTKWKKKHRN